MDVQCSELALSQSLVLCLKEEAGPSAAWLAYHLSFSLLQLSSHISILLSGVPDDTNIVRPCLGSKHDDPVP